jgi:hypothetical protein
MRVRRSALLASALVTTIALPVTVAPPASAVGLGGLVFLGNARVTTGLGVPIITGSTPTVTPGGVGKKTPLFTVGGGNVRTGTLGAAACLGVKIMFFKNKAPLVPGAPVAAHGFACSLTASFTIRGFCGLSSGSGTGSATFFPLAPGTALANTISFNFTFIDPGGGNFAILGNWWIGGGPKPPVPEGDLTGRMKAIPISPAGGNCLAKTQQDFLVSGDLGFMHPKVLP